MVLRWYVNDIVIGIPSSNQEEKVILKRVVTNALRKKIVVSNKDGKAKS